jgi:nickel superoxide dismutase
MSRATFTSIVSRGLRTLDRISPPAAVHAHCDIPCGIYDPHLMQLGALTVIRMHQLIEGLQGEGAPMWNSFTRYVVVKEEHAELVKREARVIWGDYFKPEHLEKHKDLHDVTWQILKLASKVRQTIDMQAAQDLLAQTQRFAEIFWDTKGVATKKQPSNQAVGGEIVVPAN